MRRIIVAYYFLFLAPVFAYRAVAQAGDSAKVLHKVTVSGLKKKSTFTAATPLQTLNSETLQQINAPSVGDAARYFSGVQVKDYGGVGGLKTVSVRSLGAAHTGILYDGIPASDVQSGQIDLSRYSTTFVQSIDLQQAQLQQLLQPARAYSYGAVMAINTPVMFANTIDAKQWRAGLKAGSFGLWQPYGGIQIPVAKKMSLNISSEAVFSKGDYPFNIINGVYSEKSRRQNGELRSLQGEVNLARLFNDSSSLQVKLSAYNSSRGLPGAVILYIDRSVQHLWNKDLYFQSRYRRSFGENTGFLVSGRYSRNYTRYTDPDYLNNAGGLDNRYTQEEAYAATAIDHKIGEHLTVAASSDVSYAWLASNMPEFVHPTRWAFWNNVAVQYNASLWQLTGSLLLSTINDDAKTGTVAATINKLTPSITGNLRLGQNSPFMVRLFYKHVFRMPTFNDLYYNMIGNSSLRPEYARQYNAGLVFSKALNQIVKHATISVDGYYNLVDDKIIAVPTKNLFSWTMLNKDKVDIKGVDVTAELNGQLTSAISWFTRIAYTYQRAIDISDPKASDYKNTLPYTPDHSGSGLFSLQYGAWSGGYSVLFSSTRYVLGENNPYNQLDGWGTQDAFLSWAKNIKAFRMQIRASADNLLNKQYDVVRNFPMPGRSFKISLQLNNL
ncbi:MAG TPA: TonB-dependent receptor plug domain-containing protein [Niastella sp.]